MPDVGHDIGAAVRRSIVDDDQFEVRQVLAQYAVDRALHDQPPVVDRKDDRNARPRACIDARFAGTPGHHCFPTSLIERNSGRSALRWLSIAASIP